MILCPNYVNHIPCSWSFPLFENISTILCWLQFGTCLSWIQLLKHPSPLLIICYFIPKINLPKECNNNKNTSYWISLRMEADMPTQVELMTHSVLIPINAVCCMPLKWKKKSSLSHPLYHVNEFFIKNKILRDSAFVLKAWKLRNMEMQQCSRAW